MKDAEGFMNILALFSLKGFMNNYYPDLIIFVKCIEFGKTGVNV